jgi:thioredoxin reductase
MIRSILAAISIIMTQSVTLRPIRKVAVIGAGAGGLVAADALKREGFDVIIFEKEPNVGGVWKYKEPNHGSSSSPMYKSLRTNLPKQIMAYSYDTPFPDTDRSFLTHQNVQSYLEDFAERNSILPLIKFGRSVVSITAESGGRDNLISSKDGIADYSTWPCSQRTWKIQTISTFSLPHTASGDQCSQISNTVDYFDAVVVCNGHYNVPLTPSMSQANVFGNFRGEVMHSIDYDCPDAFKGKSVLVVGGKSSGTDLAREIASVAHAVYASERSSKMEAATSHKNIHTKPGIQSLNYETMDDSASDSTCRSGLVQFTDMSVVKVDILLWCTGYAYDYPFLFPVKDEESASPDGHNEDLCSVEVKNRRKVCNLYQQVFSISEPTLSFIGLPYSVVPFPLFFMQAKWIAAVYAGRKKLPSKEEQSEWLRDYEAEVLSKFNGTEEIAIQKFHFLDKAQWKYRRFLARSAGLDNDKEMKYIDATEQIYNDTSSLRPPYVGAPDTYRDSEYHLDLETFEWTRL